MGVHVMAQQPGNLTTGRNYIHSLIPLSEVSEASDLTVTEALESVTYYDGLGRPVQEISRGINSSYQDLITQYVYDPYGRESEIWLPSTGNGNGAFVAHSALQSNAASLYSDANPFSSKAYEARPQARIISSYGPGQAWRNASANVTLEYSTNSSTGNLQCRRLKVTGTRYNHNLVDQGIYGQGELQVIKSTDEDGRSTFEFKDAEGRTILERTAGADTYYVYDDFGNLCYVMSPEGMKSWMEGKQLHAIEAFTYQYRYDERNRCIAKKLPGAGWETFIYDHADRVVFHKDANQGDMEQEQWHFTFYDDLSRPCMKGLYNGDASAIYLNNRIVTVERGNAEYVVPEYINTESLVIEEAFYYDNYNGFVAGIIDNDEDLIYVYLGGYDPEASENVKGLLTAKWVSSLDGSLSQTETYFYDKKGRLIQTRMKMSDGSHRTVSTSYDFRGKPLKVKEAAGMGDLQDSWIEKTYTYNHAELPTSVAICTDSNNGITYSYEYDDLNRLKRIRYGNLTEDYTYNIRDWMTRKQVQKDGTPVFDLTLRYESTYFDYFDPQYGGNISEILWSRDEPYSYGYAFDYDAHSRVTDALYMYDENNIPGCCSEEGITYDKNGNLLTLYRYDDNGEIADIRNTYSGNHLTGNTYDAAGNVTYDRSSGLSYQWNHLNLIKNISETGATLVNYSYLADGTKLSSLDDDGDGLLYRGSLIYRKTDGEVALESILFEGGRFVPNGGPMLHVTDHLGSVRAVVNALSGEVTETSDYFPFGMRMDIWGAVEDESNRYRFNGKEEQEGEFGVPTLDYGARHYSASSARWLSMDPLAEKYYSVSPYAFCNNNPVNFIDPDGRSTWVVANPDGTYTIEGGNLDDNDLNIYTITYDEDGNMNIGESIGRTTSITSFYNSDKGKDGKVKGWMKGSVIIPSDESGMRFISTLLQKDPSLLGYIWNARNNMPYDFKVTNCMGERIDGLDPYRGMPISKDADAVIYTSARDVGNIMAGYIAGRKGLAWHIARSGFDIYQSLSEPGMGWTPEGVSTQNAQRVGWKEGFMIYYKKRLFIND